MVSFATSRIVEDMTVTEPLTTVHDHPIGSICVLLGVPREDWHVFGRWARTLPTAKALDELHAYVDVMIADRCRQPGDDLLSELIRAGIDGEDLTVDELRAVVVALVTS
jgi:cytochrome P450